MNNIDELKALINANIKRNGRQAITGNVLNGILNAMVDNLGDSIFLATYGTTTLAEIREADAEGMIVFCKNGNDILRLQSVNVNGARFAAIVVYEGKYAICNNNGWSTGTFSVSEVFFATYGVTTWDEILLMAQTRIVCCVYQNRMYLLSNPVDISDPVTLVFTNIDGTTLKTLNVTIAGAWSNSSIELQVLIANDLTTNDPTKALSAAQGVALKALIDALGTAVAGKASQADLNALQQQVNTKASQSDLDATNAEVSQLGQEVNGKEVALYAIGAYTSWTDGRYIISSNGLVNITTGNSVTDYIDISNYQQIKCPINKVTSVSSEACVAFYDSNKAYLHARILSTTGSESGLSDIIAEIPDGAKYVRFTCLTAEKSSWYLSGVIKAKESLTNEIVGAYKKRLTSEDIISGSYRSISGSIGTSYALGYSVPIKVSCGDKVILSDSYIGTSVAFITRVSENGDYISVVKAGESSDGVLVSYEVEIKFDGYISISADLLEYKMLSIVTATIHKVIEDSKANVIKTENKTRLLAFEASNPLQTIIRECGYGCLLKTWGFIGDSYTSGETPAYDGSTLKYLDCYKWSWGQQFMKIIGSEGYNFSNGGQTAKGWLRSQGEVHDDTYYGGVGGGDWRHAQNDLKQGYIISLGINDKNKFGTEYLGAIYSLGDVSTDVNVSDYTQNNENTYVGCYAGIVQRILSVQPKAKIFCITQFQDDLETLNDVVRDIAALFPNNVFVIDLHNYALDITGESYYMSNGHPTPLAYAYIAACINTYVDYIIRSQRQNFMDVTLIGSNYQLTT